MTHLLDILKTKNLNANPWNEISSSVRERLLSVPFEDMAVCSVVKAELFYGALRSNNPTGTLERQQKFLGWFASLPFGDWVTLTATLRSTLSTKAASIL
jgi:tRNA(fMet)-specific endonuclease VapC